MDDDDMRRGKPTVHLAFDDATAILAGDALQALAFELVASAGVPVITEQRAELVIGLAKAAGAAGMCGGQQLDLEAETPRGRALSTIEGVSRIQALKTGALIAFSAEAGAILGSASTTE
ncbi:MAG TPA: polyprenyl synthetase family protein, partial [Hyphomicrobiaceae bacterium]|nr:polyprenyl synthetase family protein [Hyphomicrobiaceae bacterium]